MLASPAARAQERAGAADTVDVHAENVELDARTRELVLDGDVRVDLAPFHLRSDRLRIRRDERGAVDVQGPGRLGFCPCVTPPPLAVRFERALVAPPGDLVLKSPRLEILGVPVLWAPWFWLRSPGRMGLLPPEVAYRGADGVFVGEGVHVPWRTGDERSGLDLRAGGYFQGGAAVEATLATPASATRVAWDHLRGDGLTVDARGAIEREGAVLAWDADAIRGARGVRATTDVEAAARPFDRARAESAWHEGEWSFATSLRTTSPRGDDPLDLGASGPALSIRNAGALAGAGAYDAAAEGGALSEPGRALSFARGETGALLADRWGVLGASLSARAAGDVASEADRGSGASRSGVDGAASARARLALPLARAWDSQEPNDPWVHRVEPSIAAAVLASRGDDLLGVAPGRGGGAVRGEAWLGEAGLATTLGRWGARLGGELTVAGGALGSLDAADAPRFVTRARLAASSPALALGGEAARVLTASATSPGTGGAFVVRARLGELGSTHVVLLASERDGIDPVAARALTDAPLEPSGGFLATEGWTAGGRLRIPWTSWLATTGGADVDLTAQLLVAARAGLELRDRCGCFRVRLTGAHRVGREGVDAWLAIDLVPR